MGETGEGTERGYGDHLGEHPERHSVRDTRPDCESGCLTGVDTARYCLNRFFHMLGWELKTPKYRQF